MKSTSLMLRDFFGGGGGGVDPGPRTTIENIEKFKIFVNKMAIILLNMYTYLLMSFQCNVFNFEHICK
jgi:hypothetical protein